MLDLPIVLLLAFVSLDNFYYGLSKNESPRRALCALMAGKNLYLYVKISLKLAGLLRHSTHIARVWLRGTYLCEAYPDYTHLHAKQAGGDDQSRTGDLMLAKHALSQLSYIPNS